MLCSIKLEWIYGHVSKQPLFHDSAEQIISAITENTLPQEFDRLCENFPDYKLSHSSSKYNNSFSKTALSKAITCNNVLLVQHIIDLLDPSALNDDVGNCSTSLLQAITQHFDTNRNQQASDKIIRNLVLKKVDVNLCGHILYRDRARTGCCYLISPLFKAAEEGNVSITKLLLENGAQKYYDYSKAMRELLETQASQRNLQLVTAALQTDAFVQQTFSQLGEATLAQAKNEIEHQKFSFWKGRLDKGSILCILPKEICAHILTCTQYPMANAEKIWQVHNQIIDTINQVCQTEPLSLLAHSDKKSFPHQLPGEIIAAFSAKGLL